ncbi:hypothetical protein [uncultured Gilliamella sp.]|uniref:hypothetical protein n=1 Tax=uncultured Gilliamella sp. TaxID=1193505 RepID=UPI0025D1ED39|nr:hypothetical protein [uncultured Gilliamella sp.]
MGWPVPQLLSLQPIKKPSYLLWAISLVLLILSGFILTVFIYPDADQLLFWFFAIVLPLFLWLFAIAYSLVKNISDNAGNDEITKVNQESIHFWQEWSKQQIPIFGSYVISAEQNGIKALTSNDENIPLYPEKARPLFNVTSSTQPYWFLDEVMQNLEQQCPQYRKYLTHIYLPKEFMDDDELLDAIFKHWDLRAEPIMDYATWISMLYETPDNIELSLILVCQYSDIIYHKHSKFISAMLIGTDSLINTRKLKAKSWLGRLMVSDNDLAADLNQLFSYTQIPVQSVNDIWISGLDKKNRVALAIEIDKLSLRKDNEQLLHDIDLTFAKPTKFTHYFALGMATACINTYFRDQLIIIQYENNVYLQLVTFQQLT